MCSKLGFSKGHDISRQELSHSSSAQQPRQPGKTGTVRTTQRTHGVSTYKLHCTAKTAKFFSARKLKAKQVQNMQNMLKATQTMRKLLQTMQAQTKHFLPSHRTCTYTQGHKTEGPTGTKFSLVRTCRAAFGRPSHFGGRTSEEGFPLLKLQPLLTPSLRAIALWPSCMYTTGFYIQDGTSSHIAKVGWVPTSSSWTGVVLRPACTSTVL